MPGPRPKLDVDIVTRFRKEFLEQYTEDGVNEAYDPCDVETFCSSDKYVHKFLMIAKFDFKLTGEKVNTVFKWRKQFGINDMTFESFDEEVLSMGGFYCHNKCKLGRRIVWFRICKYKKDASKIELAKKFMAFWLNKIEREAMGADVVILMDMTNAGIGNMDIDVIKFMITCFELYFPALVGIMLVYDMHWVLNAIWKVIEKLLSKESREHIMFLRGNAIQELIALDQLPPHMGGTDTWEWTWPIPEVEEDQDKECLKELIENEQESMFSVNGDVSQLSHFDDVTPDPSPKNSPTPKANKRVHFAPGMLEADEPGAAKTKMVRRMPKKPKSDIHRGPLLNIQPGEQLVFAEASDPEVEPSLTMTLENSTQSKVAYKIKTTTPDRYKVRPSAGPINPGASIKVTITLLSGDKDSVPKDKFLVISTELNEVLRSPAELTDFWKRVAKDDIVEHRVRCVYLVSKQPNLDRAQLKRDMLSLHNKVDTLSHQVSSIKKETTRLLRLAVLQFFVIMCLVLFYNPCGSNNNSSSSSPTEPSSNSPLVDQCQAVGD
ncbi:motile sperm domain-containing protein 2-like [Asterias amurensis]|uniref:motile sperm domain-containing protein 2-like n=1 Tax=Asterias amurensis TaxID=7602 RepID=UPI003AB446E1